MDPLSNFNNDQPKLLDSDEGSNIDQIESSSNDSGTESAYDNLGDHRSDEGKDEGEDEDNTSTSSSHDSTESDVYDMEADEHDPRSQPDGGAQFQAWAQAILDMPVEQEYPLFPDGDLWLKFHPSACIDFRAVVDWCWRHGKRGELDHPAPLGPGVWRTLACQGAIVCKNVGCNTAIRVPAQGKAVKIKEKLTEGCRACIRRGESRHSLIHVKCAAHLFFYTYASADIGLLRHSGTHSHARPDQRKLLPSAKKKLKETVLTYPHTKAFGLATGTVKAGSGAVISIEPLRDIGEPLVNVDRAAALRRQILQDAGIRSNGSRDGALIQFLDMQGSGEAGSGVAIRSAEFSGKGTRIVIQTDWQRELFLGRDDMAGRETQGHAGVLTDVTYSLFAEFFLCGSSVFSAKLNRWIPILWTVLRHQRDDDFAFHFGTLFDLALDAGLSRAQTEQLLTGVVDFSQAQLNGFRIAYRNWRIKLMSTAAMSPIRFAADMEKIEADCDEMLKGCTFHFEQSAIRVRRNGALVDPINQTTFAADVASLRKKSKEQDFVNAVNVFFKRFPRCRAWLAWWLRSDIKHLIFPALKTMAEDRWTALPTTTSALENQHYILYMAFEKKMDLIAGSQCLQALAETYEAEHVAEGKGVKSRYGTTDSTTRGTTSKRPHFVNDGRAPDSSGESKKRRKLSADSRSAPSFSSLQTVSVSPDVAVREAKAKDPVPSSLSTVVRQPPRKAASREAKAKNLAPSSPSTVVRQPPRKAASARHQRRIQPLSPPPHTGRHRSASASASVRSASQDIHKSLVVLSYLQDNNTCYITSMLECLWAVWTRRRAEWVAMWDEMVPGGGIEALTRSMQARERAHSRVGAKPQRRGLQAALQIMVDWVVGQERLWQPGQYGNWTWGYRRCDVHGTRYEVAKLTTSIDLAPDHSQEHHQATFSTLFSRHFAEHAGGSCKIKVVDACGQPTILGKTIISTPTVLFIDLVEQNRAIDLVELEHEIVLNERIYRLVGRVCASTATGEHFTAIVHHSASTLSPHRSGIYDFNDCMGRAELVCALEDDNVDGAKEDASVKHTSPQELIRPRRHAIIAIYLAQDGAGQVGQIQDHASFTLPAAAARKVFKPYSNSATRLWGVGSCAPRPADPSAEYDSDYPVLVEKCECIFGHGSGEEQLAPR